MVLRSRLLYRVMRFTSGQTSAAVPGSVAAPTFLTTTATACVWFTTRQSSTQTPLGSQTGTETAVPKPKGELELHSWLPRRTSCHTGYYGWLRAGHLTGRSPSIIHHVACRCPPWCTTRRPFYEQRYTCTNHRGDGYPPEALPPQ